MAKVLGLEKESTSPLHMHTENAKYSKNEFIS